jgi:hypothetical protein
LEETFHGHVIKYPWATNSRGDGIAVGELGLGLQEGAKVLVRRGVYCTVHRTKERKEKIKA